MNYKWLILALVLIAVLGLWMWSGMDDKTDKGEEADPHQTAMPGMMPEHDHPAVSTELPTVDKVRLAVKNVAGEELGNVDLEIGKTVNLKGTGYLLRATDFYTYWNYSGRPVNLSYAENNPAVKIDVLQGDSVLYHQWAFKNVPFFGLGGLNHPGGMAKDLGFSLLVYEGLKIPAVDSTGGAK
ncbi:hypothetical protein ACFLQJ_01215 [Calditrichota bacterium]